MVAILASAVSLAGDQIVKARTDDINADQHGDNLKTDLYKHEQARIGSEADEAGHGQRQTLSHGQIKRNQTQNQHRNSASSEVLGTAIALLGSISSTSSSSSSRMRAA